MRVLTQEQPKSFVQGCQEANLHLGSQSEIALVLGLLQRPAQLGPHFGYCAMQAKLLRMIPAEGTSPIIFPEEALPTFGNQDALVDLIGRYHGFLFCRARFDAQRLILTPDLRTVRLVPLQSDDQCVQYCSKFRAEEILNHFLIA